LNAELERLTQEAAPELCAIKGIGLTWQERCFRAPSQAQQEVTL
jgi:hypothetical protein